MWSCGTILSIAMTFMRHTEIQCVWPQWWIAQRCRYGRIVEEGLLFHHKELIVSTHTKVWCTNADDRIIGNVWESFNDQTYASHLLSPRLGTCFAPILFFCIVSIIGKKANSIQLVIMNEMVREQSEKTYVMEWAAISWPLRCISCTAE